MKTLDSLKQRAKDRKSLDTNGVGLYAPFEMEENLRPYANLIKKDKSYCFWGVQSKDKKCVIDILSGKDYPLQDGHIVVNGQPYENVGVIIRYMSRKEANVIFSKGHLSNVLFDLHKIKCDANSDLAKAVDALQNDNESTVGTFKVACASINEAVHTFISKKIQKQYATRTIEDSMEM